MSTRLSVSLFGVLIGRNIVAILLVTRAPLSVQIVRYRHVLAIPDIISQIVCALSEDGLWIKTYYSSEPNVLDHFHLFTHRATHESTQLYGGTHPAGKYTADPCHVTPQVESRTAALCRIFNPLKVGAAEFYHLKLSSCVIRKLVCVSWVVRCVHFFAIIDE